MKIRNFMKTHKVISATALMTILSMMLVMSGVPGLTSAAAGDDPAALSALSDTQPVRNTINVSATGKIEVSPDIAFVTVGAISENSNALTAQQQNANAMSNIITALKNSGISENDIKTSGYSISPKYSYNKETGISSIVGYSVSNQVRVTVRDVTKAGNVIDIAATNGANMSGNIVFDLADREKAYNDALRIAVRNAETRAKTIADTLGIAINKPSSVTESGSYYSPVYKSYDSVEMRSEAMVSTPISSGTFEITSNVSMTYNY